jgi:hypothetical protein
LSRGPGHNCGPRGWWFVRVGSSVWLGDAV